MFECFPAPIGVSPDSDTRDLHIAATRSTDCQRYEPVPNHGGSTIERGYNGFIPYAAENKQGVSWLFKVDGPHSLAWAQHQF